MAWNTKIQKHSRKMVASIDAAGWVFDDTYTVMGSKWRVSALRALRPGKHQKVAVELGKTSSSERMLISAETFAEMEPDA